MVTFLRYRAIKREVFSGESVFAHFCYTVSLSCPAEAVKHDGPKNTVFSRGMNPADNVFDASGGKRFRGLGKNFPNR